MSNENDLNRNKIGPENTNINKNLQLSTIVHLHIQYIQRLKINANVLNANCVQQMVYRETGKKEEKT